MVTLQRGRETRFKEIGTYDTAELALQSFRALMALEGRDIHYTRQWRYDVEGTKRLKAKIRYEKEKKGDNLGEF